MSRRTARQESTELSVPWMERASNRKSFVRRQYGVFGRHKYSTPIDGDLLR